MKYTVIRDTREKLGHGWTFPSSPVCEGTIPQALKTGDYTLVGYEEILTIDRKGSLAEFVGNLQQKRFERELQRMAGFEVAAVFLEFDFEEMRRWPEGSGIPSNRRRYMKFNKHVLLARFWEIQLKYPHVLFMFVGPYGREAAASLFKRVIEKYGKSRPSQ
jgi:hypothetical protein